MRINCAILECRVSEQCDQMLKLKVAQIFPKVAQNVARAVIIGKWMFFKIAKKSLYISAFLKQNISPRTLEIRPIWSHCK